MELTKFTNIVFRPCFQVVKTAINYEIQSNYLNHLLTILSFLQLASTALQDFEVQNYNPDLVLMRVIDWSNYPSLIGYYLNSIPGRLYLVIGVQIFSITQFLTIVRLSAIGHTQDTVYKFLLRVQAIHQQIHIPLLLVPAIDTMMHFLIVSHESKLATILAGSFLIWPILFAILAETRFGVKTRFFTEKEATRDLTFGCYFFMVSKILLATMHQISYFLNSFLISYIANGVCAFAILVIYFREMNFRSHIGANFYLAGIASWISCIVFVAIRQAQNIFDLVYVTLIVDAILICSLIYLNKYRSECLLKKFDFEKISVGHLEFVTKEIYSRAKKADLGDPIAQHDVLCFLESFASKWYRKNRDFIESKELDSFQGYEDESKTSRKLSFKAKLKELLMVVLDLMYRVKISKALNKENFHLIVNYVLLSIHNQKNFFKAYRTLLDYIEKNQKIGLNLYRRFVLEGIEEDVKQVLKAKFTPEFLRAFTFKDAVIFDELFAGVKKKLLDTIQKHAEIYNVLLEKPLDLDKILHLGLKLVKKKKKLEEGLARLFALNPYHSGNFFLYRTYLNLDIAVNRIPNFTLLERRYIEYASKGSQASKHDSSRIKDINLFAKETCVIYLSLSEKKIGKIIKHTSSMAGMFGYSEEEAKYLRLESLQPVCIAAVHNKILMNHIESTGKSSESMIVPAVTREQFLLPLNMILKIEEIDRELCVAGFISKAYVSGSKIVLDKWGHLLNYTANFHSKIGLEEHKERKPLYGFNIGSFAPKLIEMMFPIVAEVLKGELIEVEDMPGHIQEKHSLGEVIQDTLLVPFFPDRMEIVEKIFTDFSKEFNPLSTTGNKPEHELFYLERLIGMSEALFLDSSKNNTRVYKIELKLTNFSKTYNQTTKLNYYTVDVSDIRLLQNPNHIDSEILRYKNMIFNLHEKLDLYKQGKGLTGKKSLLRSHNRLIHAGTPALEVTGVEGTLMPDRAGDQSARPKIVVSEPNCQVTQGRSVQRSQNAEDDEASGRNNSIYRAEKSRELYSSNASSQEENLKEVTLRKSLDRVVRSLANSHVNRNGVYHKNKIVSFSNIGRQGEKLAFDEDSDFEEESKMDGGHNNNSEFNTEKMVEALQTERRNEPNQEEQEKSKSFKRLRDSISQKKAHSSARKEYEAKSSLSKGKDSMTNSRPNLTVRSNQPSIPELSPRNKSFLEVGPKQFSTSVFLSSNALADSLGLGNKVSELWSLEIEEKSQSKSSDLKIEVAQKREVRIYRPQESQQTSNRTGLLQKIALLHLMIFDKRTPTYINRLKAFGLIAFGIFVTLATILFIFLMQFFSSYSLFVEVADFTCPLNTAISFFVVEQQKILFQNDGIFDPAFMPSNQTYSNALQLMKEANSVYLNKYKSVVEITNIQQISQNFEYSSFDQTLLLPQPDGSTIPENTTMTGALVHMFDVMYELMTTNFSTINNKTSPVVFLTQNYDNYFYFLALATHLLFQDLYGTNQSVDIQSFSKSSLVVNLSVLFIFIAVLYPLFRKNETNQIKALTLFGTFTPSVLEKRIETFKYFHSAVSNYRDKREIKSYQRRAHGKTIKLDQTKGAHATKRTMGWRKRRVNVLVFLAILAIIYGAMSTYFITDALRISKQNTEFLLLIEEYDLSTDEYSFAPALYAITYSMMGLYTQQGNDAFISATLDGFSYAAERIAQRKADMMTHMIGLDSFLEQAMVTSNFTDFMLEFRGSNMCDLVSGQGNISASDVETCKGLVDGVASLGITSVLQSIWDKMDIYNQTITNNGYSRESIESIVNTEQFVEYDSLLKFVNSAFSYWIQMQHQNLQDALNQQKNDSIISFCVGIIMLLLAYFTAWRWFIWNMQTQYHQAKSVYSVIPADLLLANNYIKKFLRDNSKVAL